MKTTTSDYSHCKKARGRQPNGEPNPIDIHIGNRLRLRRQILQLSQQQLGEMLGLTFQQVQKYEHGINRISGSRLWDFACILGVDVNFFYADMDKEIFSQSPRCLNNIKDDSSVCLPKNLLQSERALKITKAFLQIKNPKIADNLYNLIISLGTSQYLLNKAKNA